MPIINLIIIRTIFSRIDQWIEWWHSNDGGGGGGGCGININAMNDLR